MRVCEGQNLGALTILIVSLSVYGGILLNEQRLLPELFLPWGIQGPEMMAVEVTGSRDTDGIYFLPKGSDIANILNIIDIEGKIDTAGFAISNDKAIAISAMEGTLTITDMPAIRRIALGLPIDLNRASADDLSLVPGIGDRLAIEIVQQRKMVGKFTILSDLTTVPGIKEKKLKDLKKYLTVESVP